MKKFVFFICIMNLHVVDTQTQEPPHVSKSQISSAEYLPLMGLKVFRLINQSRVEKSLKNLHWDTSTADQAREHSLNMANGEVPFSHEDAKLRFERLRKRIPSLTHYGENVAFNFGKLRPAEDAVDGWLDSHEHYVNIMGDFNLTGVGVVVNKKGEYYFTQIFIKADPE